MLSNSLQYCAWCKSVDWRANTWLLVSIWGRGRTYYLVWKASEDCGLHKHMEHKYKQAQWDGKLHPLPRFSINGSYQSPLHLYTCTPIHLHLTKIPATSNRKDLAKDIPGFNGLLWLGHTAATLLYNVLYCGALAGRRVWALLWPQIVLLPTEDCHRAESGRRKSREKKN